MPLWPILTLPWLCLGLFLVFRVRLPPELPPADEVAPGGGRIVGAGEDARKDAGPPRVSVIVPARNEEHNVRRVLESLAASRYPRFEIIVVDDRSEDGTGDVARAVERGRAERIEVVDGDPLPEGWLGKPWACHQGSRVARGEVLLFTDADTVHGPDLLARAVAALDGEAGDALTLAGRQLMESFWERLVQPQIFTAMLFRFPDHGRPLPRKRWRAAIANGQYIMFRRTAYEALGGHEAVRDAVVEDLRLAQILVREGWRFRIFRAEDAFSTRMYRSLGEIVAGWSKNIVLGGLRTLPPAVRPFTPPLMIASGVALWLLPPVVLLACLAGLLGGAWLPWSVVVVGFGVLFWAAVTARFGAPWWYGLLYPVGSAVGSFIVLRSWIRMGRVEWKGRTYTPSLRE